MAIKRLTIELDDAPDRGGATRVPDSLRPVPPEELKARPMTGALTERQTEETESGEAGVAAARTSGRTIADLVAEFINDPRAMATLLFFAPFVVFAGRIEQLDDLIYPTATGALLNVVWFGVSLIRYVWGRMK